MVNKHLRGKEGFDFAILATGSNDISDLDLTLASTTLFTRVSSQSKTLVDIADAASKEMDIDVFIVEKPPRYDTADDPHALKQKLSKYSNAVIATLIAATPRLHLVEQASLGRVSEKARAEIFQTDGLHLTQKGVHYYSANIIEALKTCYPEDSRHQRGDKNLISSEKRTGSQLNRGGSATSRGNQRRGGYDQGQRWENRGGSRGWRSNNGSDRNNQYYHSNQYPWQPRSHWGGYGRFHSGNNTGNWAYQSQPPRDFGWGFGRGRF